MRFAAADDVIEELPSSRPIESDLGRYQEKAKQYEGIVLRLTQLSEERKEIRLRVEKLRRIRDAVQRLSATDESNIQDNLVTRNGPVEKELERMRVLLARVTSRVANLPEQPASDRPQSITSSTVDLGEMMQTLAFSRLETKFTTRTNRRVRVAGLCRLSNHGIKGITDAVDDSRSTPNTCAAIHYRFRVVLWSTGRPHVQPF